MEDLASGYLTIGSWGGCLRRVGADGAINGRCVWRKVAKANNEETTNFPTCQCWHIVLAPHKKINLLSPTSPPAISILECHACSFGNRSLLHLFSTMKLQWTC